MPFKSPRQRKAVMAKLRSHEVPRAKTGRDALKEIRAVIEGSDSITEDIGPFLREKFPTAQIEWERYGKQISINGRTILPIGGLAYEAVRTDLADKVLDTLDDLGLL